MSDVQFTCPGCEQVLEAPVEMAGETVECPACEQQMIVPELPSDGTSGDDQPLTEKSAPSAAFRKDLSLEDVSIGDEPAVQPKREELSLDDISIGGEKPAELSVKTPEIDKMSIGTIKPPEPHPSGSTASPPTTDQPKPALSAAELIAQAASELADDTPAAESGPTATTPKCPECDAAMAEGAVLCTNCGFHQTLGKKISTEIE